MFYVYILESQKEQNKFYVGLTSDLERRLKEHNSDNSAHTQKFSSWKIRTYFAFDQKERAQQFEIYLKTHAGRIFQKNHF